MVVGCVQKRRGIMVGLKFKQTWNGKWRQELRNLTSIPVECV